MFTRRERSDASGSTEHSDTRHRVPDRGWGPFTGRQLTVMIVTLAALVMVPGAAYAVTTFTNVALQDPVTGARANVDATHHLVVGDGTGPLTVDGSVNARSLAPAFPFHFSQDTDGTAYVVWIGPSAAAIDLTNLTIALKNPTGSGPAADVYVYQYGATADGLSCNTTISGFQGTVYHLPYVTTAAPVSISFPTPLVLKPAAGKKVCLVGLASGGSVAVANGSGFYG